MRYDQFMALGWKYLIPISLGWIIAVGTIRAISLEGGIDRQYLLIGIGVLAVAFLALFFVGEPAAEEEETVAPESGPAGFPVPPMPAGGPVRGSAAPLTFPSNTVDSKVEAGS
jgi:NADH-quinone oxidoreductase subunit H